MIEPEQLVPYLGRVDSVDLSRASVYEQLHIPHAIHLQPKYLVAQQNKPMVYCLKSKV
jgi:thiosulfate/3-mercaptopyruvate sulfurtransferase